MGCAAEWVYKVSRGFDQMRGMSDSLLTATPALPETEPSGADLWLAVVHATIELLHDSPVHDLSVNQVAATMGAPLRAVLEQFPTWGDLLVATVQVWNAERMAPLLPIGPRHGAVALLRAIAVVNVQDPTLMRVLTAMVDMAATPSHPLAGVLQRDWIRFHALIQRTLADDIASGREPDTMEPARGAEQLIAPYEGLQLQSMLRPNMDVVASYERAVARLRDGWSRAGDAAVWSI